jgi:glutamate formiminotransferase
MTVECVPNFSEGRNVAVIDSIARAVSGTPGARLLDRTSDADHNRSVLTFLGSSESVANAAFAAVQAAVAGIDLSRQTGVHPRLGAADVVPFVPLDSITLEACSALAHETGKRIWDSLGVPVYFYEAAALRPECVRLENVRKFEPLGLLPDLGHGRHPTAGACVVGARKFLIAWNINLHSRDLAAARAIAGEIRESSGGLPAVKALGLRLDSRGQVQVSINLVDFELTPLHVVYQAVAALCRQLGIEIAGSELIGMIPPAALEVSAGHDLRWQNLTSEKILSL